MKSRRSRRLIHVTVSRSNTKDQASTIDKNHTLSKQSNSSTKHARPSRKHRWSSFRIESSEVTPTVVGRIRPFPRNPSGSLMSTKTFKETNDEKGTILSHHHPPKNKKKLNQSAKLSIIGGIIAALVVVLVVSLSVSLTMTKQSVQRDRTAVLQWNSTGITVAGLGSGGNYSNRLLGPYGFTFDQSNTLYIAEYNAHRIVKWVPGAVSGTVVAGSPTGIPGNSGSNLNRPVDIFLQSNSDMYITDRGNQRLQFWPNGASSATTVLGIGSNGTLALSTPSAIVQNPDTGVFYITASGSGHILQYPPEAMAFTSNLSGTINNRLANPIGLVYDDYARSFIIGNHVGHGLVRWKPGSNTWTPVAGTWGTPGNTSSLLNGPVGITMDMMGNIYCTDALNHRIQLFPQGQSEGITIAGITGINGTDAKHLYNPYWVKLDNQLNLYVADISNFRIQKFLRY